MKYKIVIEYSGTNLIGWQKQKDGLSVQEVLERAIKCFSQEEVTVYGSSRTDAGVHACSQVAHFSLQRDFDCHTVQAATNFHLGDSAVRVLGVEKVREDFHARFSTIKRKYIYKIINRGVSLTIDMNRAWCVFKKLDVDKMKSAAKQIVGKHDFTSFRSSNCQAKNPVRTLDKVEINQSGDLITIQVEARSFLHSQVRIIVGTLKEIGEGRDINIKKVLEARDRTAAGVTAPPFGLYLLEVVTPTGLEPVLPP